jgi:simple sugar transport system ATP-binding protein
MSMTSPTAAKDETLVSPLIELKRICKSFGKIVALDHVDFEIRPNEVVGLLGDNGAGKSTLVKVLSGVVFPEEGAILRNGSPVKITSYSDAENLGIETIYQDIALVNTLSVYRNMFLGREQTNAVGFLHRRAMRSKTMEILRSSVKISGIDSPDQLIGGLSGGQRQAVAIARAVYFRKKMLLLDEPTSALSVRETENVLDYIVQLRRDAVSCVFVTHNVYHAFRVCDRFVILSRGRKAKEVNKGATSLEELTAVIVNE